MTTQQSAIISQGEEILKRMESHSKSSLFSKDFWYGSIMEWSMKNEKFKTNMFRFVDVLPSLNTSEQVLTHLKEYFTEGGKTELPAVFSMGLGLGALAPGIMAGTIKKNVISMAKMFITGENAKDALDVIKKNRKNNLTFTADILGEATLSEKEAGEYSQKYLELIDELSTDSLKWTKNTLLDEDADGAIPSVNVSVKMSALYSQINDKDWDNTKKILVNRLYPIFKKGMEKNIFVNLDMEHYAVKHLTVDVFEELLSLPDLKNYKFFGCVVQAYLRDSFDDLKRLVEFSKKRGTHFTIRLVKGAYWDSETIDAKQRGWSIPVYLNKAETDANYEHCASYLLDNYKHIRVAIASHNVRTLSAALVKAQSLGLPKNVFEIQMLYGMAEPIKKALADMGYRVREYAPIGDLLPGMAYLVRRLLENTSNESWLRGKFADNKSTADLLADPQVVMKKTDADPYQSLKPDDFINEPLLDFAVNDVRDNTREAIKTLSQKTPFKFGPIINGQSLTSTDIFKRENPSEKSLIIAEIQMANTEHAEKAMISAHQALKSWKNTTHEKRVAILNAAADIMKRDRYQLIATQVLEVGKPWAEADADVCEAIDFLRYYAKDYSKNMSNALRVGNAPGEISQYIYKPRGVVAVISPWNFPLAILAGQVSAALVTGNTVVMKPAEQSSLVALGLYKIFQEAGLPSDALQFLPGYGENVGDYIVKHKYTTTIAFTGSKAVGLLISKNASQVVDGQIHVKRCIIEMGGKNAVIVDNDADLDEAVDGILYSAFGFAGQKCSAASRVVVLDSVYEKFSARLVEAAKSIQVSSALDPAGYYGPVVDADAYNRLQSQIEKYKSQHKLLMEGSAPHNGYFVPITIFGDVKPDDQIAHTEFFGPILALIKAKNLDEAIDIVNNTEYALTGGLFSRSPASIEKAKNNLEVGNMYINRGITGAMVDRHPFGGFKMSGIGSKTGGPDYLKQFTEPVVITENTMRRGFAPEE